MWFLIAIVVLALVVSILVLSLIMMIRYWRRGDKWMAISYFLALLFMVWVIFIVKKLHNEPSTNSNSNIEKVDVDKSEKVK